MVSYTEGDLAQIRACIASGVLSTRFADGREVKYQNLDQLLAAEKVIAAAVEISSAAISRPSRKKLASFRSGC